MIVYNYINYINGETQTEFKRKRALADKVFTKAKANKHEYHPITDFSGFLLHVAISNKLNESFIIVAENKEILPDIKFPYEFVATENYLKG